MKEIGKAKTVEEYQDQIDYIESILCTLDDLQNLYKECIDFNEEYKEVTNQISWLEETLEELEEEKVDLENAESEGYYETREEMMAAWNKDRL